MANDVLEINQECAQGLIVQARLTNGRMLRIEKKEKHIKTKYTIDVLALDGASKQKIILGWKWFIAGIAVILLMGACLEFMPFLDQSILYWGAVYLFGLCISGLCFFMARISTSRKQTFSSRNSNVPIVELAINNPSRKEFNNFINKVEECIELSRRSQVIPIKKQLAGEMKMLRRLSENGVVTASAYKKAKAGLLDQH